MIYQRRVGWPEEKPPDARPGQRAEHRREALLAAWGVHLDREQEQDEARGERGGGGDVRRLWEQRRRAHGHEGPDAEAQFDRRRVLVARSSESDRLIGVASSAFSVASDEYTRRNVGRRIAPRAVYCRETSAR